MRTRSTITGVALAAASLIGLSGGLPVSSAAAETGITWSAAPNESPTPACRPMDVTYGGGRFVTACYYGGTNGAAGKLSAAYSNGTLWKASTAVIPSPNNVPATATRGFSGVAFGDGRFVGVATRATSSTSTTTNTAGFSVDGGLNWTLGAMPSTGFVRVTYGGGKFVAVGYVGADNPNTMYPAGNGLAAYSTDGVTWTTATLPGSDKTGNWVNVSYGNGKFVAVANNGTNRVMTSTDGINWAYQTPSFVGPFRSVTYGNGLFVAVCTPTTSTVAAGSVTTPCPADSKLMTSPDGATWTTRTVPAGDWSFAAFGQGFGVNAATSTGNLFVVTAADSTNAFGFMSSPDGVTWTGQGSGQATAWRGVAFGNGYFNAVIDDNSSLMSGALSGSACGDGVPYTKPGSGTSWLQYATPCSPAAPGTVSSTLGTAPTSNLSSGSYNSQWVVYGRNATNSGNTALAASDVLSAGSGYWFGALSTLPAGEPVDNKLVVTGGTEPSITNPTGCMSLYGCVVVSVSTTSGGTKMIGNPLGTVVNWSDVRIRVDGGTPLTPVEANTADFVSNQFWIWTGSAYDSWNSTSAPGNLQYSKSFFIKVLPTGVGKTIDLLIPAATSTITTGSVLQSIGNSLAAVSTSVGSALSGLIASPSYAATAPNWTVKLKLEGAAPTQRASVSLGQYAGSATQYDSNDLAALSPSFTPYLTMVFPRYNWGAKAGDYLGDFRAATGAKGDWPIEIRTDRVGGTAVLKWEGDKKVLMRSRLTNVATGKVINPTSRAYANGYVIPLKQTVTKLKWTYLGQ